MEPCLWWLPPPLTGLLQDTSTTICTQVLSRSSTLHEPGPGESTVRHQLLSCRSLAPQTGRPQGPLGPSCPMLCGSLPAGNGPRWTALTTCLGAGPPRPPSPCPHGGHTVPAGSFSQMLGPCSSFWVRRVHGHVTEMMALRDDRPCLHCPRTKLPHKPLQTRKADP